MALFQRKDKLPEQELERLKAARQQLEVDDVADAASLPSLRSRLAAANLHSALNGEKRQNTFPDPKELENDARTIRAEIAEVENRIQERLTTRPALLAKIRDQMRAVAAAKAAEVRKQAAKLRTEYTEHLAKRDELQRALEEHAGIAYRQHPYPTIPAGQAVTELELELMRREPKSVALERQGRQLEQQASAIEQQAEQACQGGIAVAGTLDELLEQTAKADLGPVDEAVRRWHENATASADRQWAAAMADYPDAQPGRRVEYRLFWDGDGVIDSRQSKAVNHEERPPVAHRAALPILTSQGLGA